MCLNEPTFQCLTSNHPGETCASFTGDGVVVVVVVVVAVVVGCLLGNSPSDQYGVFS